MIKKRNFFILIHWMLVSVTMQASTFLIDSQELRNLAAVKQQLKNIQFEAISFDSFIDATKTETLKRRGILVRKPDALGTVIICHGYLGCKRDAIAFKHLFPKYNVLSFDFRAHGDDRDGQVSTIGRDEAFDVMGAVQVVKSDPMMANKPIIAFGYSMGAVSAIEAQSKHGALFDAMILDCPYDSTDAGMSRGLQEKMQMTLFGQQITIPGRQFLLDHMYDESAQAITNFLFKAITKLDSKKVATKFVSVSPVESIKKVTVPCFFIHCEGDKKVPIQAVESVYNNKPGFKRLWITQGKNHFGSYLHSPEMYWYKVNKFLAKLESQDITTRDQEKICDQRTRAEVKDNKIVVLSNEAINPSVVRRIKSGEVIAATI